MDPWSVRPKNRRDFSAFVGSNLHRHARRDNSSPGVAGISFSIDPPIVCSNLFRGCSIRLLASTLLLAGAFARPALAQEFNVLLGTQRTLELGETAPAWSFEYLQNLNEKFYASFTWLNEGHVTNHHRDGHSVQMWYRWLTPSRSFVLSGGIGPYSY